MSNRTNYRRLTALESAAAPYSANLEAVTDEDLLRVFTVDLPFMGDAELRELLDLLGESADWQPGEIELVERAQDEARRRLAAGEGKWRSYHE